jgi:hydrogenase-4 membrane subunit HyfE
MGGPIAIPVLDSLNTLTGGLFLLTAFGIVAARQARASITLFVVQSLLLACSAGLLGVRYGSWHLYGVALVNIIAKPVIIPWILRRTVHEEVYTRREIEQVWNIPTSLLLALAIAVLAYFLTVPMQEAVAVEFRGSNMPIGFAALLLGAFTLAVRREAVPLLVGLLAMENGAFFAGISLARTLPLLVELAIATDGLIIVFISGVLIRAVHQHVGTTQVGALARLKEQATGATREGAISWK